MATYQFSLLTDGQAISFDPTADVLNIDQVALAAAFMFAAAEDNDTIVIVQQGTQGGKDVRLLDASPFQLTSSNVTFADGSRLLIGDNSTALNDDAANTLIGSSGWDLMLGFGGNDIFVPGGGSDDIRGGAGRDSIEIKATATSALIVNFGLSGVGSIIGGGSVVEFREIERVVAGNFNDQMYGDGASQNLAGQAGNDTIRGAGGTDTLWGGAGNDAFLFKETGAANADLLPDFASGADKLLLDGSVMNALGAAGNMAAGDARFWASSTGAAHDADDRVLYNTTTRQVFYDPDGNGAAPAQLIATLQSGATLAATDIAVDNPNTITGTAGDDTLSGTAGDDTIDGLAGNDSLVGGHGRDSLIGGDGNDTLNGVGFDEEFQDSELTPDTMEGGSGDDYYVIDHPDDVLFDSSGHDTVQAENMDWTLGAGFEDLIIHNDVSEGHFTAIGNELDNHISASYAGSRLEGRGGNDTLIGGGAERGNQLFGGDGNDSLVGGEMGDLLDGGAGDDTLSAEDFAIFTGGTGVDTFLFDSTSGGGVTDFTSGSDRIRLDARSLAELGASGTLAAGDARFHAAAGATGGHDADDRLVYNTATGDLYYDADGNGAIEASVIATLTSGGAPAALSATDITVDNGGTSQTGTAGNDSLVGGSGNDLLNGLAGNDTLAGLGGHDTLDGGSGTDRMEGGDGDDTYYATSGDVIVELAGLGTGMFDTVIADTSWTLEQNVEILRLVEGAPGAIRGTGNAGSNGIYGNSAANVLDGGGTSSAGDTVSGGGGNDTITGSGFGSYSGDAGDDFINVGPGSADGGDGNDRIEGFADARGGFGDDTIVSGTGHDSLYGGPGADTFIIAQDPHIPENWDTYILFETGADKLRFDGQVFTGLGPSGNFTAGDERFYSAPGAQSAHDATDRLVYNSSNGQLWYDPDGIGGAAAVLTGVVRDVLDPPANLQATDIAVDNGSAPGSTINGTSGNDTLSGTNGNDTINGLGGDDIILGASGGSDVVDGGAGRDSIEFKAAATSAVVVDYASGAITGGGPGSISFTNIERVVAGNFNDSLSGAAGGQNLTGQAGADTLWGAAGADTLWGGTGNDAFVFREMGTANADRVSDFASGQDKLQLDDSAFTAIGAMGNFAAGDGRFWAAAGASSGHDVNDRVIYNTSSGALYYDADGSGSGAAQLVATLTATPALAASDIAVI